ncbi:MAG: hypothetical protein E7306_11170 [Butyrivibrio sp.]|nr:hypothetical protein [Butyrivibrio sp.]
MLFTIAFLILIVFLFVEIFRYIKVKANAFSRKEVKRAAQEQVQRITYRDPVISCDYCGGKIDTTKFTACPQCGAPFDNDEEWKTRHNVVPENFIDKSTDEVISLREQKALEESKRILKNIKRTLWVLGAMILIVIIIGISSSSKSSIGGAYRSSEKLKDGSYYKYSKLDYEVDGDGVIYDYDDVKISVTGFYKKEYDYVQDRGAVAVEFVVENNRDEDIKLNLSCNSYNGISSNSTYIFIYDTFKKNSKSVFYEEIREVPDYKLSEVVFDEIKVRNTDYSYEKIPYEPAFVRTNAVMKSGEVDLEECKLVYSNDKVEVYAKPVVLTHDAYRLFVKNISDKDFYIENKDIKIDNMLVDSTGLYKCFVPAWYTLRVNYFYAYGGDEYKDLTGKNVSFNLEFNCTEEPSASFQTGYIDISKSLFEED